MAIRWIRGDFITGMAVSLLIAIPFSLCLAGVETRLVLTLPPDAVRMQGQSMWLPIPECQGAQLQICHRGSEVAGNLVETAYIRDQRIGRFELEEEVTPQEEINLKLKFTEPRGDQCVDAGPLTRILDRTLTGYGLSPAPSYHPGVGSVARCVSLAECAAAAPDILLISGHAIFASSYVDSIASLWAVRMGLNTAIIDAASISITSPVVLRDFIKDLYDLECATHFGDGHLGFVVLLGDAYEDDNATRMVIDYDGYGGTSEASDHFYACVAGSDDFEDIMLGRIPAGNVPELANYYAKLREYTPVPADAWSHSLLFMAGGFFASKTDYVDLFDRMDADIPDDYSVSRWYRYDYPLTTTGDQTACQAVTDSLNKGFLMALYAGDGDKWDWGGATKRAFKSSYMVNLTNSSRLPIVLSIACSNGWFDNRTQFYGDLGVDCFAERILFSPTGGAIGCVAASREVGGGAATVFAPEIIRSAFVNGSSFLGELMLEAKTRHLLNLGSVAYVRQFNLFGDPCLNFVSNDYSVSSPDLVIRPYRVRFSSEFPTPAEPLTVSGDIWNASGRDISSATVGLYSGHPDSGGVLIDTEILSNMCAWEERTVTLDVPSTTPGSRTISLVADPFHALDEADETNNVVEERVYVYPCQNGFPVRVDDNVKGQVVCDLDNDGEPEILVISGGGMAQAIDLDGSTIWVRKDLGQNLMYGAMEPAAADLNGDGTVECVIPIKSGVIVVDGATGVTRWKNYTDYACLSPSITDIDGDGSFEVLVSTYAASSSRLVAFDASGARRWTYDVPGSGSRLTGLVTCDTGLDGKQEIIYSTAKGAVTCLSCESEPPTVAWTCPVSTQTITSLVAGDLERDGSIEAVASSDTTMTIFDATDGTIEDQIRVSPCEWSLSLGDVDGDKSLEIICSSSCGEIGEIDGGAMVLNLLIDGTPHGAPVLADLDSDNLSEIVFTVEEGSLRIIRLDGTNFMSPMPLRGPCLATPVVSNIDSDAAIEVVAGSVDSVLFVVDLATRGRSVEWSCGGGSALRSGLHAQPLFGDVSGSLSLSGRIDVLGDVNVAPGMTLTFERASDVRLVTDEVSQSGYAPGQCELTVEGSMIVRGTRSGRVRFGPIENPPAKESWQGILLKPGSSGSFTQATFSGAIAAIECQTSEVTVSECSFDNSLIGVKTVSSSPLIDSNTFNLNDYGISASGGSPIIVNNTITSNVYGGITLSSACTATLEANSVSHVEQGNGLAIYSSSPIVGRNNRFEGNYLAGIYLSNSSPTIDSCWVGYNGDCGIKAAYYSNPVVARTSIVGNKYGVGVYMSSNPILGDTPSGLGGTNDIRQNALYAVYNRTSIRIKAQGNWWGGTPVTSMFLGQIDYSGWLDRAPAGVDTGQVGVRLVDAIYPNPFSQSVRLGLNLTTRDLPVTVNVYDIRGRLVRKVLSGGSAGKASLVWDGTDTSGNRASSGAYFVTVVSRTRTQTSKVVLLH
jgi:hypothetical protein